MTEFTFTSPHHFRLVCEALGLELHDLVEIFDISQRSAERWLFSKLPPESIQAQVHRWVTTAETARQDILADLTAGGQAEKRPIVWRIRDDSALPSFTDDDHEIWWWSARTYRVHLHQLALALTVAGIAFDVETTTTVTRVVDLPETISQ